MHMTANSNLVWKREADEHQRWAKILTRVSVALAVALLAIGSYAYSTHVQYGDLCETLRYNAASQSSPVARKTQAAIVESHCGA
jgi:hypothetical protein